MVGSWLKRIVGPSLPSVQLNRTLHHWTQNSFEKIGFRWQERRLGDQRMGGWFIPLRRALPPAPARKRIAFLPGFGDTPLSWLGCFTALIPQLKRRYDELVFFDFPGFGGFLQQDPAFSSMDLLRKAAGDFLDEIRPRVLLGHSLGGWLAAHYAAQCGRGERPLRCAAKYSGPELLIPICPAGVAGSPEQKEEFQKIFERALVVGFEALRPHVFGKEPVWFPLLAADFNRFLEKPEVIRFIRSIEQRHSLEAELPDIRAQTRLIWAERDTLTPRGWIQVWRERSAFPPQALIVPGSGHSPQIERPLVTTAALLRALGFSAPGRALQSAWGQVLVEEGQ